MQPKKQRLPTRNRMTLALAMVADTGLILAADTRVSYDDGSIADVQKITGWAGKDAMYAVVHSSHDANAADSLIHGIRTRLEDQEVNGIREVETQIRRAFKEWYVPVHDARPTIQLLLGCSLKGGTQPFLYYCEPPSTVKPIGECYTAIGDGWQVSDAIYKWFEDRSPWAIHPCLCQISYMMYRAKKLRPSSVGGYTDVGILTDWQTVPYWINRTDMAMVESFGLMLDRHLSNFASMAMGGNAKGMPEMMRFAEGFYSCELLYARQQLRSQFPEKTFIRIYT
jgi:hypothetical protein